jgi:hypothetical protein
MKRLLLVVPLLALATGCGPDKRDVAQSQVNQIADTWDGGPAFTPEGADPWGEPYTAKIETGDAYRNLTVRSNGPDKLPQTKDDIVATRRHKHTPLSEAAAPAVEKVSEALGKGLGRGAVAGIREGITGKKPEEKKADPKKPEEKKPEGKKD